MNTLSASIKNAVIGLATVSVLATGAYVYQSNNAIDESSYAEVMINAAKKYVEGNEISIDGSMTTNMSLLDKLGYFDKKINAACIENSSVTIINENGTYVYVPNMQCDEEIVDVDIDENSIAYVTNQGVVGSVLSYDKVYSAQKYTTGNVEVNINLSEPIEEIENSGWTLSNNNRTLTKVFTSNESESITVYSNDSNLPATIDVDVTNIDKTAPVIKVDGETNKTYYTKAVTVTIEEENIKSATMNNTDLTSTTIELSKEGKYEFVIVDEAGNSTTETVVLDWTAPKINRLENNKIYNDNPLVITYSEGNGVLTGGNLSESKEFISGGAIYDDGKYTLTVTDDAGNQTAVTFVVDKLAPSVIFDADGIKTTAEKDKTYYFNKKTEKLVVTFEDTLSPATATLNGKSFTSGTEIIDEGEYTLIVTDSVNSQTIKFVLDKTEPTISGVIEGGMYNTTRTVSFGNDIGTLINNDTKVETSVTSPYSISTEGSYTLKVTDAAGNESSVSFTIDLNNPVFKGIQNDGIYKTAKIDVEDKSSVTITDNGKQISNGTTISEHGTHKLVATDAAGRDTEIVIFIDQNKPVINGVEAGKLYNGNVTPTASDDTALTATLDGKTYTLGTSISASGKHTLVVTDAVGNTNSVTFIIDKVAPSVTFDADGTKTTAQENKLYYFNKETKKLTVSFKDEFSSATATLNGENFTGGEIAQDGEYTLIVTDGVNSQTIKFIIDKIAPTITGVKEGDVKESVTISHDGTKAYLDDVELTDATITSEGLHKLVVEDAAGNKTEVNFTIDRSNPEGSLTIGDETVNITDGMKVYANKDVKVTYSDKYSNTSATATKDGKSQIISSEESISGVGEYTLTISDSAGHSLNAVIVIETEKPIAEIVYADGNKELINDKVYGDTLEIVVSDESGIKSATLNGKAFTSGTEVSDEGKYELKIDDAAGNEKIYAFTIDKTAPTVTVEYDGKSEKIEDFSAIKYYKDNVKLTFSDNLSKVTVFDENNNDVTDILEYSEDGTYTLKIQDEALNSEAFKFVIDGAFEIGQFTYKPNVEVGKYTSQNITVTYIPSEDNVTITESGWKKEENGNFVLETPISNNTSGTINVTDKAGNTLTETYTVSNIDKEAPIIYVIVGEEEVKIENPEEVESYRSAIKFRFEDISGTSATLKRNDEEATEYNGEEITKNGTYTLIVEDGIVDEIKNTTEFRFTIDSIGPKEVSVSKNPSEGWTKEDVTVTLKVDEPAVSFNAASYGVTALNPDENGYATEFQVVIKENTPFVFKLKDALGNESRIRVDVENIDKDLPTMNGIEDKGVYSGTVNITFTDETSKARAILQKDGEAPILSDEALKISDSGKYTLTIVDGTYSGTEDTSYNSVTYTFTIDNEKPNLYLVGDETETQITESNTAETPVYYTSAVKFRFEDSLTSASATLNGDTYESNKSISKNGTYVLVVEDELGNKIEHHFVIDSKGPQQIEENGITMTPDSSEGWTKEDVVITLKVDEPAVSFNAASYGVTALNPNENGYATEFQVVIKENTPFVFKLEDALGNESRIKVDITHIDKDLPTISSVEDKGVYTGPLTITFADETSSAVALLQKEGGNLKFSRVPLEVTESGKYTLMVADGTYSGTEDTSYNSVTYTFTIDNEKPNLYLVGDETETQITESNTSETPVYYTSAVKFRFEDSLTSVSATLNGEVYTSNTSIKKNGTYALIVEDELGNEIEHYFVIDSKGPQQIEENGITISPDSGEGWTKEDVTVTLKVDEPAVSFNAASYGVTALNPDENGYATEFQVVIKENTPFVFKLKDALGNESRIRVDITHIDKDLPVISGVEDKGVYSGIVKITFSDVTSSTIALLQKEGGNLKFSRVPLEISESGKYTLMVADGTYSGTEDTSYNSVTYTFTIDNEVPIVKVVGEDEVIEESNTQDSSVTYKKAIAFEYSDSLTSANATLNGEAYANNTVIDTNGTYVLVVEDELGNKIEYHFIVDIDTIGPQQVGDFIMSPDSSSWTKEDVTVTIEVDEPAVSFNDVSDGVTALNPDENSYATKFQVVIEENTSFTFKLKDEFGNASEFTAEIKHIDKDLPTISGVEDKGVYTGPLTITFSDATSSAVALLQKEGGNLKFSRVPLEVTESGKYTLMVSDGTYSGTEDTSYNSVTYTFTIDNEKPNLYLVGDETETQITESNTSETPVYYTSAVKFRFEDSLTSASATLNGEAYTNKTTIDENATYVLIVKDELGNSIEHHFVVDIDKIGPQLVENGVTITPASSEGWTKEDVTVTIEVDEPAVSFNDVSDGVTPLNPDENGYATKFQVVIEENTSFTFRVNDQFENKSEFVVNVEHIDKDLPTVSGVEDGGAYGKAVKITFADETSGAVALLQKENGELKFSRVPLEVTESGKYTLMVADGTYSGTEDTSYNSVTYTFTIDNDDPRIFITIGDESEKEITDFDKTDYYNKTVKFRLEDLVGIEEVTLQRNGSDITYTDTILADGTTDGEYTLTVKDKFHTVTYNFVIDTVAPSAKDTNISNGIFYSHDIVLETSAVRAVLNGVEHEIGSTISAEQVHRLKLYDEAGNESATIYFGIDKSKPIVSINNTEVEESEDTIYYQAGVIIDAKDLTAMKAYIITDGVEEAFTLGSTYSVEGVHTLKVVDAVGHTTMIEFAIDTIDPVIQNVADGEHYNTVSPTFEEGTGKLTIDGVEQDDDYISGTAIDDDGVYTLTVTDNSGRTASVTFTVDTIAPVISGIDKEYTNKVVNVEISDTYLKTVNGTEVVDGKTTIELEYVSDGEYTITATDKAGNEATKTFTLDRVLPELYLVTGDGDVKVGGEEGTIFYKSAVKFYYNDAVLIGSATLNGANYVQNQEITSGKEQKIIITDKAGNSVSHVFTIDTDKPTTNIEHGKVYSTDVTIEIEDATTIPSATIDGVALTDENKTVSAETIHTLVITDEAGNTDTITFTIDKTAPVITVTDVGGKTYTTNFTSSANIEVGSAFTPFAYVASDVLDTSIDATKVDVVNNVKTNIVSSKDVIHTITYKVTDHAGHEAVVVVTVNVVDTTKPVITLNSSAQNPQYVDLGDKYTELGATASDNYDGTFEATATGTVNVNKAGTYTITYNATDAAGNKADAKTRTIIVRPVTISDMFQEGNDCADGTDCYNKTEDNNYVWYSGYLWRVIKVNADGTLKMITESPISAFAYHRSSSVFSGSYIEQWLNNNFYNSLEDASSVVVPSAYCADTKTSSNSTPTCSSKVTSKVGLLTLDEYNQVGGSSSFLKTGDVFFTMTPAADDVVWTVIPNGTASAKYRVYETYGIRPVITVNAVNLVSGTGTMTSPYRIEGDDSGVQSEALTKQNTGEYVNFSGFTWRVISTSSAGTKLILDSYLKDENGNYVEIPFGTVGVFETTSGVGQYLNSTFLNRLDKSALVTTRWYYNKYALGGNPLTSSLVDTGNYTGAYVGLIRIGDLMSSNSFTNRGVSLTSWVINPYISSAWYNTWVGVMDYYSNLEERGVKPVITLSPSVKIASGSGTHNSPYELKY